MCSTLIWSGLASSSSAMMVAKPVNGPCPNSMCLQSTVMELSGAMRMKAFGTNSGGNSAAAALMVRLSRRGSRRKPMTKPVPASAPPFRSARRPGSLFHESHGLCLHAARGVVNGGADAGVGGAAAEISAHRLIDVLIGWLGGRAEESGRRHDLAGLAIAALRHLKAFQAALTASAALPEMASMVTTSLPGHGCNRCYQERTG